MKSLKPNDPRRLTIKSIDKIKETYPGDQLTLTVKVTYDTWCCTQGHEYAHATKAVTDLFDNSADEKERRESIATNLEMLADKFIRDGIEDKQVSSILMSASEYLKELGEEEYHD